MGWSYLVLCGNVIMAENAQNYRNLDHQALRAWFCLWVKVLAFFIFVLGSHYLQKKRVLTLHTVLTDFYVIFLH